MSIIIQYLEKLLLNWSIDDPSNCQTRPPFKVLHPVMKQRLGEGTLLYRTTYVYMFFILYEPYIHAATCILQAEACSTDSQLYIVLHRETLLRAIGGL